MQVEIQCEIKLDPEVLKVIKKYARDTYAFAKVFAGMKGISIKKKREMAHKLELAISAIVQEMAGSSVEIKLKD